MRQVRARKRVPGMSLRAEGQQLPRQAVEPQQDQRAALQPDGPMDLAVQDAVNRTWRRQVTKRLTAAGEPDREVGSPGLPGRDGDAAALAVKSPLPRDPVVS